MSERLGVAIARTIACIALVTPVLASAATEQAGSWLRFETAVGRFAIDMPVPPVEQQKKRWLPIGSVVSRVYTARVRDDALGLNHTDLPRVAMLFTSQDSVIQSAREGFLEDSLASEVSFEATRYQGRAAHLLRYSIPSQPDRAALVGTARMFFVERRLYIVWTEVTASRDPADVERYFASFALRDD